MKLLTLRNQVICCGGLDHSTTPRNWTICWWKVSQSEHIILRINTRNL